MRSSYVHASLIATALLIGCSGASWTCYEGNGGYTACICDPGPAGGRTVTTSCDEGPSGSNLATVCTYAAVPGDLYCVCNRLGCRPNADGCTCSGAFDQPTDSATCTGARCCADQAGCTCYNDGSTQCPLASAQVPSCPGVPPSENGYPSQEVYSCATQPTSTPDAGQTTGNVNCSSTGDTCSCTIGSAGNATDCSVVSTAGGACCASSGWPSSGTCDCVPHAAWTCAVSATGSCRCGPGVTPRAGETDTISCSPGGSYVCCGDASGCTCADGEVCTAGQQNLQVCGGRVNRDCGAGHPVDACRPGSATCPDKGSCSPSTDFCNCGLVCIHLGEGSYTCGDSCSSDSDCIGRRDPQSGIPYTRCAQATLGSFCS